MEVAHTGPVEANVPGTLVTCWSIVKGHVTTAQQQPQPRRPPQPPQVLVCTVDATKIQSINATYFSDRLCGSEWRLFTLGQYW